VTRVTATSVAAFLTLATGGCSYEYALPPDTQPSGLTDYVFPEDADPTIAKLEYVSTQLLVQPYPGADADQTSAAVAAAGATILGGLPDVDVTVLSVPEGLLAQAAAVLADSGLFETVHKNYRYATGLTPNDPIYVRQAYLSPANLEAAWDQVTGSDQAIIAIVDTGVDATHPELAGKVLGGWSADGPAASNDVHGHGTAVAGVAAARGNNGAGIAGVAWNSPILPVRVGDESGQSTSSDIAAGILWAAANGAKVINVSFAPLWSDRVVRSAAQSAVNRGCLVVISVGNAGGFSPSAGYPEAVFVGASDQDAIASFSDRGPFVDLVAPGVMVRATEPGGSYGAVSGTSFAAPIVSGVAALMLSVNAELRPTILRQLLLDTAEDLGPAERDTSFGEGRVDAFAAVEAAIANRDLIDVTPPELALIRPTAAGEPIQGRYVMIADASDVSGVAEVVLSIDGLPYANDTRSPYLFVVDTNTFDPGEHEMALLALDQAGNQSPPLILTIPFLRYADQESQSSAIRFRSPVDGAVVSGNVLIQASVSHSNQLSVAEWFIDDRSVFVSTLSGTSSGVSYLWRAAEAGPGDHRVTIRVTDSSGQSSTASLSLTRR
jgi:subtilisin family serine protease